MMIANFKNALVENRLEQRLKYHSKYRLLIIDRIGYLPLEKVDERLLFQSKYRLLIIDRIGYLPLEKVDERLLFQLIDRHYEKKSILAISNIPFSKWAILFNDEKVDSDILDRLLHHAYVVLIIGNSYRLKDHVSCE